MQTMKGKNPADLFSIKKTLTSVKSAQNITTKFDKSIRGTGSKNFDKYEVIIENQYLQNELKMIEWRSKSQLPIVKILFYKILQKKLLNQCSVVQVAIQSYPCNLNSLPKMPLYQLLYLLKQSLLGFQRLYDRFGSFDISNKMVLINKNSKCRVWINENITLNFPSRKNSAREGQFMLNIVQIFQDKCIKSVLAGQLFTNLKRYSNIVESVQFIDNFVAKYKLILPNKLNSITESLGSKKFIQKHENNLSKIQQTIKGKECIRKTPKFITQMKEQKKPQFFCNRSFGSPNKSLSPLLRIDRSCKKISTKINYTPSPNKIQNISSYSNTPKTPISPASPVSADWVLENKAKVDKKFIRNDFTSPSAKIFTDKKQKVSFPVEPFKFQTEKIIRFKEKKHQNNEQLYFTKGPSKPQPKQRKFSTNVVVEKNRLSPNNQTKKADKKLSKNDMTVHCSQQTASTLEQGRKVKLIDKFKINQPSPLTVADEIEDLLREDTPTSFEKNKWMTNLNSEGIRETLESQHQGADTFASDYNLESENLNLLGTMGKQLKQSINQQ